ncbi:hypothetical protein FRX31_012579, partial [Thalictrum thalictroides]
MHTSLLMGDDRPCPWLRHCHSHFDEWQNCKSKPDPTPPIEQVPEANLVPQCFATAPDAHR